MRKNGFTLVELLVTITLLAVMSVAIGVSMSGMFERQNEKDLKNYQEKLENAACVYYETNPNKNIICKSDLINASLIDKDLKSPEKIVSGVEECVKVSTSNYQKSCKYYLK